MPNATLHPGNGNDRQRPIRKAAVLVKDIPAGSDPQRYSDDLTLERTAGDSTMSGVDMFAVAAACELSDDVVAITMGPSPARGALREALSLGADRAVHIDDERLRGANARTTARVLARAASLLQVETVLLGRESSDGRLGVLGGMLAELLGWPLISAADRISSDGSSITARVREETAAAVLDAALPAVLSVAEYGAVPRGIGEGDLRRAFRAPIEEWSLEDVACDLEQVRQRVIDIEDLRLVRERVVVRRAGAETLLAELDDARVHAS